MPTGVNQAEQIVGLYGEDLDFGHLQLGFLRNFNGTMATFNGGTGTVTSAEDINDLGQVIGSWVDLGQVSHGFLRNPDGTIISFDAGSGGFFGTAAVAINAFGQSTGFFR